MFFIIMYETITGKCCDVNLFRCYDEANYFAQQKMKKDEKNIFSYKICVAVDDPSLL